MDSSLKPFLAKLDALPAGYGEGHYGGRRYGLTLRASVDGRRRWLYGEELGGPDRVSCNVYLLGADHVVLRPCEMPADKVVGFVLGFEPSSPPG